MTEIDPLVQEQIDRYQQHGWQPDQLAEAYRTILGWIDSFDDETLSRAARCPYEDWLAQKAAIEQLVPHAELQRLLGIQPQDSTENDVVSGKLEERSRSLFEESGPLDQGGWRVTF